MTPEIKAKVRKLQAWSGFEWKIRMAAWGSVNGCDGLWCVLREPFRGIKAPDNQAFPATAVEWQLGLQPIHSALLEPAHEANVGFLLEIAQHLDPAIEIHAWTPAPGPRWKVTMHPGSATGRSACSEDELVTGEDENLGLALLDALVKFIEGESR